jgi:TM2 domain
MKKNKTVAAWLSFLGGVLGLHRFYLYGSKDLVGWLLPVPTLLGLYGVRRAQQLGLDDTLSWLLIPLLGFSISVSALYAIVYALTATEIWNAKFNPALPEGDASGQTGWLTIGAIVCSLLVGTTVLMSSIAFSFQHYFEYQIDAARKLSQP